MILRTAILTVKVDSSATLGVASAPRTAATTVTAIRTEMPHPVSVFWTSVLRLGLGIAHLRATSMPHPMSALLMPNAATLFDRRMASPDSVILRLALPLR